MTMTKLNNENLRNTCILATKLDIKPGTIVQMFRLDDVCVVYQVKNSSTSLNAKYSWTKNFLRPKDVLTFLGFEVVEHLLFFRGLGSLHDESLTSKWLLNNKVVYIHWTNEIEHPKQFFKVLV